MGEIKHAAAQVEQQQLANTSIVIVVERNVVAGRLTAVAETLWQCQRGDDSEGANALNFFEMIWWIIFMSVPEANLAL